MSEQVTDLLERSALLQEACGTGMPQRVRSTLGIVCQVL